MVSQVYDDVGFSENVSYYTYLKTLCFKNLVQSGVLFLKQSEHSYYAFQCIDFLTVTENQMIILTPWCIATCPHRKEKRSKRKNLVQSEVLCLKESEQSYYAFLCSDLLIVTGNQMILNYDLMYRQESIWKTTKKKYEIMMCTTKIHDFIFWWQVNYYF